jgi:hypothetical protein
MFGEHQRGVADHTNVLFAAAQAALWLDLHEGGWQLPSASRAKGTAPSAVGASA